MNRLKNVLKSQKDAGKVILDNKNVFCECLIFLGESDKYGKKNLFIK